MTNFRGARFAETRSFSAASRCARYGWGSWGAQTSWSFTDAPQEKPELSREAAGKASGFRV